MGAVSGTRQVMTRLLSPIWRRMRLIVSRGVIRLVDDSLKMQGVQVRLLGSATTEAERFQEYGFTSVPHPGAEAVMVMVGASRAHPVAVAVDDRRHRPKGLEPGETMLYTDEGDQIHMRRGRVIAVTAGEKVEVTAPEVEVVASTKVTLDTPETEVTGNMQVGGTLDVTMDATFAANAAVVAALQAGSMATVGGGNISAAGDLSDSEGDVGSLRQAYNSHRHTDSEGGTTSEPDNKV